MPEPSEATVPVPVVPAFDGACLSNLLAALREPTDWVPPPVVGARQVVLLLLDGLGWEQLGERRQLAPVLASGVGGPITSVAPSTTAVALTSLTTGLPPAVHGVVGYRVGVGVGGEILNVLTWQVDGRDARRRLPPRRFQPFANLAGGAPVPVVTRAEYAATGFSAAHLSDGELHGWSTPSGLVVEVRRLLEAGAPLVYAYYDGIDRVSHARGLGEHYDAELVAVDRLVADVCGLLGPDASLVVTADHGQVHVGSSIEVLDGDLMDGVVLLSGEGRFRWLHARPGAAEDLADAARERYGRLAWVRTREEVVDDGWLGGEPVPDVADRLGDVALVPFAPTAFLDPADTGEQRLVGRHGSLTSAEMLVPLLAWRG
ncbi:MAG: alkaline phosphatase family protein [Acidimicrobiales bacterium]